MGPPFNLFDILQQTGFSKSPKGPPFTGLKTLRFLSLRYSADFRRSRLVLGKQTLKVETTETFGVKFSEIPAINFVDYNKAIKIEQNSYLVTNTIRSY